MHEQDTVGAVIDTRVFDAVLFDMDGVVTDSASIHQAAWRELFDTFLADRPASPGQDRSPFTDSDYERFVDGKPRYDGVTDFLAARGMTLPRGEPSDPPDASTVCGLGNRKDQLFLARVAKNGVPAFDSTVALVRKLRATGMATAVFSASRNCAEVLAAAGLGELFPVRIDGVVADELGLRGKPDPAMLLEAADRLHVRPERTVVVEDAEAGVAAGRRGGFGLVIGVDRIGHAERLREFGAEEIVTDLAEVQLRSGFPRMSEIPDALEFWPRIADRLQTGKPAVLLDFDGTLSDIVADPGAAALREGMAQELAKLAERCPVAIVSGRDLDDLRARVGIPGIWYAGCHGFELMSPHGRRHRHAAGAAAEAALARAVNRLGLELRDVPGVVVDDKRFAVAVHHRMVAEQQVADVIAVVHNIGHEEGLRAAAGRKVTELRPPVRWDKGRAVDWILEHLAAPAIPIYVGDDLTDEDAFDVVGAGGITVCVRNTEAGDRRTAAQFGVECPARVRDLLARLADLLTESNTSAAPESWILAFDSYDPSAEKLREALCGIGNGYLGVRGATPDSTAGPHHYPGTYAAGIYDRVSDTIAGQEIENESLVNLPNWLPLTWRIDGGDWYDLDSVELLSYRTEFDLRYAALTRNVRFRDGAGRITSVCERRFAAMDAPHICALRVRITAENWNGVLTTRSGIDTAVENGLVERYRNLSGVHLGAAEVSGPAPDTVLATVRTRQSDIPIAIGTRTRLCTADPSRSVEWRPFAEPGLFGNDADVEMSVGESVTVDKVAALYTGRDHAISAPADQVRRALEAAGDFDALFDHHALAWERLWERLRIDLDSSATAARTLRLHLLHLVQTVSPHTAFLDTGVPARGLIGEAYRGHVFWDEMFVLPVLNLRLPSSARSLLEYRYHRLPEARRLAREIGCAGALFPWQSGSDGREESQRLHLNPRSGHWTSDPSRRAHHAGIAVAYNVWQYYELTSDREFLARMGAELLVEIARFWATAATYDRHDDRYHIRGVIGPDEFHSGYPDAPGAGIDDNAYTNVMAAWVIRRAHDALRRIPARTRAELLQSLRIPPEEPEQWNVVADRMYVPFHEGVISQFAGYDRLLELDWAAYRERYGDIGRLDRILEAEGDDVNRYRAAKQADVLMLFYLLSADELRDVLGHMGYQLPPEAIPRTVEYYRARTSHGSTLSAVVYSWVLARGNRDQAMTFFDRVLNSDVNDIQGGTTAEGIHLAAMAGSIDLLQRCFTGLEIRGGRLIFNPRWPRELGQLNFPMSYRGHRLTVRIDTEILEIASEPGPAAALTVEFGGQRHRLAAGATVRLSLADRGGTSEELVARPTAV
ncbi:trehalose-phosphatase [Nocardia vaccinii]|uniref:trehalose-phosphatase n=1 Tax=Nocardia vaccinii TaxID=1822 RepID=UPI00082BB434|nr:trehalose-phosphatase [Nocardia vaccinii]